MTPRPRRRSGVWTTAGAVASAIASSACCWLPLALLGFGASAVGVAAFFERYRPIFLVAAVLLLAAGFYLNYFRKEQCAPGSSCEATNPRLKRFNRTVLWVATVFVVAFSLFPNYVGVLFGAPRSTAAGGTVVDPIVIEFAVEGMTCGGCAVHTENALAGIPGVVRATASYRTKSAVVELDPAKRPDTDSLIDAIEQVGYTATVKPDARPHAGG